MQISLDFFRFESYSHRDAGQENSFGTEYLKKFDVQIRERILTYWEYNSTRQEISIKCYVISVKVSKLKNHFRKRNFKSIFTRFVSAACKHDENSKGFMFFTNFPVTVMLQSHKSWRVKRCFIRKSYDVYSVSCDVCAISCHVTRSRIYLTRFSHIATSYTP